jgi:hypothetical protein
MPRCLLGPLARRRPKRLFVLGPIVKSCGIEIGAIWPDKGVNLRIQLHLSEYSWISKRSENLSFQNRRKFNRPLHPILKSHTQCVRPYLLERLNAVNWMFHISTLRQRSDRSSSTAEPQGIPICGQLLLVQRRPVFHQPALPLRNFSREQLDGRDSKNRDMFLIICVKVREVMAFCWFNEHSNNNTMESRNLRHDVRLQKSLLAASANRFPNRDDLFRSLCRRN